MRWWVCFFFVTLWSMPVFAQPATSPFVYPAQWSSAAPGEAKEGGTLHLTKNGEFIGYNPFTAATAQNLPSWLSMGVSPLMLDPETDQYRLYMATSIHWLHHQRTAVITLRHGMHFSDGTEITARDFVDTAHIHQDPAVGSNQYASLYIDQKKILFKTRNRYQFEVIFPTHYAKEMDTIASLTPWPSRIFWPVYQKKGAEGIRQLWPLSTPASSIVSPGPFTVTKVYNGRAYLKRNPYFGAWNVDSQHHPLPYIHHLVLYAQSDANILELFLTGHIDSLQITRADQLRRIQQAIDEGHLQAKQLVNIGPDLSTVFMTFNWNLASKPHLEHLFRTPLFRHAISHLMDRDKMISLLKDGMGYPLYGPIGLANKKWQSNTLKKYTYNPEKAIHLLHQLGYRHKNARGYWINDAGEEIRFTVMVPEGGQSLYRKIGEVFSDDAQKAGLNVTVLPINWVLQTGYASKKGNDRIFEAMIIGLGGGYSPDWPYGPNVLPCGTHLHMYNRPAQGHCLDPLEQKINDLYFKGVYSTDATQRKRISDTIQTLYSELQPAVFIFSSSVNYAWNDRLKGLYPKRLVNAINGRYTLPLVYLEPTASKEKHIDE